MLTRFANRHPQAFFFGFCYITGFFLGSVLALVRHLSK